MNPVHKLKPLIEPASVAVVGASERPGSLGAASLSNLVGAGYAGRLYPINPKYREVLGVRSYGSWDELPETVDCAIICTPAGTVPALVGEAGRAGAKAAIVFASGFAETGAEGLELQSELATTAARWGIPLCGPNCLGLVNFTNHFMGFGAPMTVDTTLGRISAVCQSGSVAIALLNSGRGLRYRTVVSSGNEAVITLEDYLEFFVDDEGTDTIMAFVEGFRDVGKLRQVAARAREQRKPIIVLKTGRSSAGRSAAIAHTGALAGADQVLSALFRQLGIVRVMDLDELLETASLLQNSRRPRGQRLGVVGISGGEVGLLADLAEDAGLELARLSQETVHEMKQLLPPFSNVTNPLDAWGIGDLQGTYANCLRSMLRDPGVDLVAVTQDSQAGLGEEQASFYTNQARSVATVYSETDKPVVLFSNVSGGFHPALRSILEDSHVPLLQGTRESLKAIRHLVDFSVSENASDSQRARPLPAVIETAPIQLLAPGSLSEFDSKRLLAAYDIPITRQELVHSQEEAVQAAIRIGGVVALKIDSPDIQHKSDVGGVILNLADEEAVRDAYHTIMVNVRQTCPNAQLNGILVQEMLSGEGAVEVIVGVTRDSQCGPALMFGLGGIFVEVLQDVAIRVAPLNERDAWQMLAEIRGAPLLAGARGKPPADKAAIVDVLLKLSVLAEQLGDRIAAIDINPLIVHPEGHGAVAADALVVIG